MSSLTNAQIEALDRDGFVLFDCAIEMGEVAKLRERFESCATHKRESGTRHVDGLGEDRAIARACLHPLVDAAARYVLRDTFEVQHIHGRDPLRGYGQQGLHIDWYVGGRDGAQAFTSILFLDDFGAGNGATRIVPGTHRLATGPDRREADPAYRHRGEIVVSGSAGTILAFNGHVWHSATRNLMGNPRRALQCTFIASRVASRVSSYRSMRS